MISIECLRAEVMAEERPLLAFKNQLMVASYNGFAREGEARWEQWLKKKRSGLIEFYCPMKTTVKEYMLECISENGQRMREIEEKQLLYL